MTDNINHRNFEHIYLFTLILYKLGQNKQRAPILLSNPAKQMSHQDEETILVNPITAEIISIDLLMWPLSFLLQ